jgi:hypothetical protein
MARKPKGSPGIFLSGGAYDFAALWKGLFDLRKAVKKGSKEIP